MPLTVLNHFTELKFPENAEVVYVLIARLTNTRHELPFYVGETGRSFGRFGDYQAANFKAPTDFKVGTVIRQLRALKHEIFIKYHASKDRKQDEKKLIAHFKEAGISLLNNEPCYNYLDATPDQVIPRLAKFAEAVDTKLRAMKNSHDAP